MAQAETDMTPIRVYPVAAPDGGGEVTIIWSGNRDAKLCYMGGGDMMALTAEEAALRDAIEDRIADKVLARRRAAAAPEQSSEQSAARKVAPGAPLRSQLAFHGAAILAAIGVTQFSFPSFQASLPGFLLLAAAALALAFGLRARSRASAAA